MILWGLYRFQFFRTSLSFVREVPPTCLFLRSLLLFLLHRIAVKPSLVRFPCSIHHVLCLVAVLLLHVLKEFKVDLELHQSNFLLMPVEPKVASNVLLYEESRFLLMGSPGSRNHSSHSPTLVVSLYHPCRPIPEFSPLQELGALNEHACRSLNHGCCYHLPLKLVSNLELDKQLLVTQLHDITFGHADA